MIKEEAINILNEMWERLFTEIRSRIFEDLKKEGKLDKFKKAHNMAIEALKQESSRDMKEIEEIINCDADVKTKIKMISNILTAKPHYFEKQEPKTGWWIDRFGGCECSKCGCLEAGYSNYCPNCGVKMVEPQEVGDKNE